MAIPLLLLLLWSCQVCYRIRSSCKYLVYKYEWKYLKKSQRNLSIYNLICYNFSIISIPTIAMITAGSLDGTCCNIGRISSSTNHLSMCVKSFPMQTSPFTLTDNKLVSTQTRLIRGRSKLLVAW